MTQTSKVTSLKMENCSPRAAPRAVSSRGPAGNSDSTFPSSPAPAVARGDREVGGEHQLGAGQGPPGWSSPGRGDALPCPVTPPGHRHASPEAGSVPGRFRESESGGGSWGAKGRGGAASGAALSGEGRRACGLKWPRSAAGVGSAMRQGLTPPKGMLGKGKAKLHRENLCGGGGQRRAAAGSAPPAGPGAGGEQRGNLENALCARLDSVISEGGSWGWFPLPPPPRH